MYEHMTPEKIKADIISHLQTDLETREGSLVGDLIGPVAVELSKMYSALNAVRPMVWVEATSGIYLDLAAADLGIPPRKEGTKARVMLQIVGTPGYTLPPESTFLTLDNLYFTTLDSVLIGENGSAEAEAEAQETGNAYNVGADAIIYPFVSNSRIESVENPAPAVGGTDTESDLSLYLRIVAARQRPATSGNIYHYEQWALESPGVGAARVYPTWEGPGTVKVVIADEERQPVDREIVENCMQYIAQKRPVGPAVTVVSAQAVAIDISVRVTLEAGADPVNISQAFSQALTQYFKSIAFPPKEYLEDAEDLTEIKYHYIGSILIGMEGVLDYSDLQINGETGNVILIGEEVPVIGEVALTWT